MSSFAAFCFGFLLAALPLGVLALWIGRQCCRDARSVGYAEGWDAGRASVRRELTARMRGEN